MNVVKEWIEAHPNLWEFIKFNILSNVATIVNFIVMWIGTATFTGFGWHHIPFKFLIFNYAENIEQNLGMAGFLSFLVATALAQTVNFFVQKQFVFKSNAAFKDDHYFCGTACIFTEIFQGYRGWCKSCTYTG